MSLTDPQFIAWLKSPSRAMCVLVEAVARVGGVETTRYLSNSGYTTGAADAPANTHYRGVIQGGAVIAERLSLDDGAAATTFGDLELNNTQRDLDSWLSDVWVNRSVKMYVGDATWPRADFRLVFDGVSADMSSQARDVLNLKLRDKLERLNTVVSETKLGGATANADRVIPIALGEMHNISPLFEDPATLKHRVHLGAIERIIEVRSNGVVASRTDDLAGGAFTPTADPKGAVITCSVQGDKPAGVYSNTVSKLVQRLVTGYGITPFSGADLDAVQLAAFDAANPQPVGIYLGDRDNVLSVCEQLAASVGAQPVLTATGLLRLVKVSLPATGTPTAVNAGNMDERSFHVARRMPVVAAVTLGYCRNYTVQTNLQTGIPQEHKDLFAQEWLTTTATDAGVAANYKIEQAPAQVDTLLQVKADADAEAVRRRDLWKVQRTVYGYVGMPELLLEQLGGYQTIQHPDFALSGGVDAQIVSVERDWLNGSVTFEVLV